MKIEIKTDENGNLYAELPETQPEPQPGLKPGHKTTEAAATLIGIALAVALSKGWLTPAEASAATQAANELIGNIAVVALPAFYTLYRTALKLMEAWKKRKDCK